MALRKATVDVARERNGIAIVTYTKEPVNAGAAEDFLEIARVFNGLAEDRDVRAIIFTGGGDRAFMAGADLDAKHDEPERLAAASPRYQIDPGLPSREGFWAVAGCPVPVIGAINGPAIGGGLAYAACCDVLVATEKAFFQIGEINVGLLGAASQLRRLVGNVLARRMYLTGVRVTAAEMAEAGAVYKILPTKEEMVDAAMEIASEIAAKSPIAVRMAKEVFVRLEVEGMLEAYRMEQGFTYRLMAFEDSREATQAFKDKRKPEWKWR